MFNFNFLRKKPDETHAYHSRFGGLWIDRSDWPAALAGRVKQKRITDDEAGQIQDFIRDGYIILPQAAALSGVDAFQKEINTGFREGNSRLLYQAHGSHTARPLDGPVDRLGTRVVDSYVALPQALDLFESPRLLRFLNLIFDQAPCLFQSLSFDQGSQQGLHQDTAYVVVDSPLELAACWIALEDVQVGSGELMYVPGSHRFPDFDFGRGRKHWSGAADDHAAHAAWGVWLREETKSRGLPVQTFLARKGDILIWHADLAHGGSPVTDSSLTRQSLVGHFCPASCRPYYFDNPPHRPVMRRHRDMHYSSSHYDLATFPEA